MRAWFRWWNWSSILFGNYRFHNWIYFNFKIISIGLFICRKNVETGLINIVIMAASVLGLFMMGGLAAILVTVISLVLGCLGIII